MSAENLPEPKGPSTEDLVQRSTELDESNLLGDAAERAEKMMQLKTMSKQMDDARSAESTAHFNEVKEKYRPTLLDEEGSLYRNKASGGLAHKRANKQHDRIMDQHREARNNVDTEHKDMAIEEAERIHPTAFKQPPADSGRAAA